MTLTVGDGNSEGCAWRERFASITKLRSASTLEASEDFAPRHGLTRVNELDRGAGKAAVGFGGPGRGRPYAMINVFLYER